MYLACMVPKHENRRCELRGAESKEKYKPAMLCIIQLHFRKSYFFHHIQYILNYTYQNIIFIIMTLFQMQLAYHTIDSRQWGFRVTPWLKKYHIMKVKFSRPL